jgi:glycosyltransferase involved in cell wall biosynthesis
MRILFHSNAPWMKTGYGQQTAIWAPRLASLGHDVAVSGYTGMVHGHVDWNGIPVYAAGTENAIGMDVITYYYEKHRADLVIALCDAWALSPRVMAMMPSVAWTPVDAGPPDVDGAPAAVGAGLKSFFAQSGTRPLAMSRWGQQVMLDAGITGTGYVPHGIDTQMFAPPEDRAGLRAASGYGAGTFVVGMVQANRSGLRKALPEQLTAFARFHRRHPDSRLMLHMAMDHNKGQDLPLVLSRLGVEEGVAFFPDMGVLASGEIEAAQMPQIYGGLDVLLHGVMAGGFEIPIAEAQACGVPVIATRGSAMTEVAGPHSWLVDSQEFWVEERHEAFWGMPLISSIDAALEAAWQAREDGTIEEKRRASREHALQYDADRVLAEHWAPYLEDLEAALKGRRPARPAKPKTRTVWSPVMFRDELDMLDMRLHETDGMIDRHVITEAAVTHRGVPKPLFYRDNQGRFAAHASKITAVAADLPHGGGTGREEAWANEHAQRDAAWPLIDAEAADGDVVLICDLDEIPSPGLLERAGAGELPDVCAVRMRTFLHAVDWEVPQDKVPPQCVIATAGYIRGHGGSLAAIRDARSEYPVVTDGGWHFSWLGGPEAARRKLQTATCHTELLDNGEGALIADGTRYRTAENGGGLPVTPQDVGESWPGWIRGHRCPPEWFRPKDLSDTTLILTAWRRPDYFRRTLDSWAAADGTGRLRRIIVALKPSDAEDEQRDLIGKTAAALGRDIEVRIDSLAAGKVKGPHRAIAEAGVAALADRGCRFLVFSEEDITVSDDVLSFMTWGRQEGAGRALAVCAHNALGNGWQRACAADDADADQETARLIPSFSPWCWGTWRDVFEEVLEPQWDYDCNTGTRGFDSGYDWQLQRLTERHGAVLVPDASRSQNIGREGGIYADPGDFEWTQARSFREHRDPSYRLVTP